MTEQQHPLTPPPELVQQWRKSGPADAAVNNAYEQHIATQAARWGADQELEACFKWTAERTTQWLDGTWPADALRASRRPKPPSLAEQALEALEQIDGWAVSNMNHLSIHDDLVTGVDAIRSALERLQELEKGNE